MKDLVIVLITISSLFYLSGGTLQNLLPGNDSSDIWIEFFTKESKKFTLLRVDIFEMFRQERD